MLSRMFKHFHETKTGSNFKALRQVCSPPIRSTTSWDSSSYMYVDVPAKSKMSSEMLFVSGDLPFVSVKDSLTHVHL